MSELSTYGKFTKLVNTGLATAVFASATMPDKAINSIQHMVTKQCVPNALTVGFDAKIYIDSSASDKIADMNSLCELVQITGSLMGAQGSNEVLFISKHLEKEKFERRVRDFVPISQSGLDNIYRLTTREVDPLGGIHVDFNVGLVRIQRSIVIIDVAKGVDNLKGLLIELSGELGHTKPDGLEQNTCGEGDLDEWPNAYAIALGAKDQGTGKKTDLAINYQTNCTTGVDVQWRVNEEMYNHSMNYRTPDGRSIWDIGSKALNLDNPSTP